MKRLYLVRHAKSSWENSGLWDFDRPLNERGNKDAPRMGKRLKQQGVLPGIILSSPAVRALTTAEVLAHALGFPKERITTDKRLYQAGSDQILTVVRELKDLPDREEEVVMIVGHNPGLSDFASLLLGEELEMPTCAVVAIRVGASSWQEAAPGLGKLILFDVPKHKAG